MKTKLRASVFCQICGIIIVLLLASPSQGAEPPNDFLQNNFGIIREDNILDTGVSFTNILATFKDATGKTWVSDNQDQWILKISKKDLATDLTDEMAWVFQRRKAEPKPLIVLVRFVANKDETPSVIVAEMANSLAARFVSTNQPNSITQPTLKPIEPFGGLKWDDGVVQTIKKVNQMEGIEIFSVVRKQNSKVSLKGLVDDSEIIKTLTALVYFDIMEQGSYKDKDGARHPLAVGIDELAAEPIYLKDRPFRMTLSFVSSPGFAIANPNAVFSCILKKPDLLAAGIPEKEVPASCSFALINVTLSSASPLQSDKIQELTQSLRDKYKAYNTLADSGQGEANGELAFQDSSGNVIRSGWTSLADGNGSTLSINYSHSTNQLDQLYKAHLSDLENKASSKKPDQSDEL
jgi:hypothetical protein